MSGMSPFLLTLSLWLHSLATVVFIGHYILLALIYLPALTTGEADATIGRILTGFSKRSRPWLYAALVVLVLTGTYMTFGDPNYRGIGNFGDPWAILMLVKHIIIVGMIAAGFWFNGILKVGSMAGANPSSIPALKRLRSYVNGMAIAGALVLLLTAAGQAQ
jgi:uncharacterized membrane protein